MQAFDPLAQARVTRSISSTVVVPSSTRAIPALRRVFMPCAWARARNSWTGAPRTIRSAVPAGAQERPEGRTLGCGRVERPSVVPWRKTRLATRPSRTSGSAPPVALGRLIESANGQLLYQLAHPRPAPSFAPKSSPARAGRPSVAVARRAARGPRRPGAARRPAALMRRAIEIDVPPGSRCDGRRLVSVYTGGQRLRDLRDRLRLSEPPGLPPPHGFSDLATAR